VLLTEINDIAQALWGRKFGRVRITPRISPNKSLEGWLLGLATTLVVAVVLAPVLTPLAHDVPFGPDLALPWVVWPVVCGLIIGTAGLIGDLLFSAIKRDAGVKDSGTLLPGQGGVLDRIDSLCLTAPLLFYFVNWLYQ
jgi:phosphatidate cytidylyltransferase